MELIDGNLRMKIINNYPGLTSAPYSDQRTYINGDNFFKYRQRFRNKTQWKEKLNKLFSTPIKKMLHNIPSFTPRVSEPIKMRRINEH